MIRREVDRRTALVAMGSVLATTSLGYLAIQNVVVPTGVKTQADASTATYVPSPGISALPPAAQNLFLAWDQKIWQTQQAGGTAFVSNTIKNIMETSGKDQLKCNLATFIRVPETSCPHPWCRQATPSSIESLVSTATRSSPVRDRTTESAPSCRPSRAASSG